MQNVQFIDFLAKEFIDKLKNYKIGLYNDQISLKFSECTDFLDVEIFDGLTKIHDLLANTSAEHLFEKYLSFGLYKTYDQNADFNFDNWNEFIELCHQKCYPIGSNNQFFEPFSSFTKEFIAKVLPNIEIYAEAHKIDLMRKSAYSKYLVQFTDEIMPIQESKSCPYFLSL